MKKLLLSALILFILGCKKQEKDLGPNSDRETLGIKSFSIPGIPDENIDIQKQVVKIKLPAGFQGDFLKPTVTVTEHFKVPADIMSGFNFEGENVSFTLESEKFQPRHYDVVVLTEEPIAILSSEQRYDLTINPNVPMQVKFAVSLPGTGVTVNDLGDVYRTPIVIVKNKADGSVLSGTSWDKGHDSLNMHVLIDFPLTAKVGEYEATIQWGDKTAKLPATIAINYGELVLYNGFDHITPSSSELVMHGYNIAPGNVYEAILENDFIGSRKISLTRKDYYNLTAAIPKDLPLDSYKVTTLVNGEILAKERSPFRGYADLFYRKSNDDLIIKSVSQPSMKKTFGPHSVEYYEDATAISRSEALLINVAWSTEFRENNLKLVNRTTNKEFILKNPGVSVGLPHGMQVYSPYTIPNEIPNGEYEAYLVWAAGTATISGRYPRILTIQ
ncbi:hypothetical protein [Dyadobacter sp. CY323]|uniref:hypothetical protein n=1 Tax=Dyadobacter sp. CY323 TaxID=2907302 RepID=UPI001F402DD3|nr:hypothetical protein [Dyadobacter sp. CY323]MCE6990997.1 hypothetical protein [Dyadobacter sp. CY323]